MSESDRNFSLYSRQPCRQSRKNAIARDGRCSHFIVYVGTDDNTRRARISFLLVMDNMDWVQPV